MENLLSIIFEIANEIDQKATQEFKILEFILQLLTHTGLKIFSSLTIVQNILLQNLTSFNMTQLDEIKVINCRYCEITFIFTKFIQKYQFINGIEDLGLHKHDETQKQIQEQVEEFQQYLIQKQEGDDRLQILKLPSSQPLSFHQIIPELSDRVDIVSDATSDMHLQIPKSQQSYVEVLNSRQSQFSLYNLQGEVQNQTISDLLLLSPGVQDRVEELKVQSERHFLSPNNSQSHFKNILFYSPVIQKNETNSHKQRVRFIQSLNTGQKRQQIEERNKQSQLENQLNAECSKSENSMSEQKNQKGDILKDINYQNEQNIQRSIEQIQDDECQNFQLIITEEYFSPNNREQPIKNEVVVNDSANNCLLYTSDAADDMQCVDLGGRRIIKKKKQEINQINLICRKHQY
eukprot:TRINITY_DN31687_c0_g1_i1.p1 TRINITY_DN31687_c0_g1~~TRINITY_DN31687_c0_g1_i1.p1  ORF type:complete len:405 (+),score=58.49 TRINITY_DN31687_c0_g1_i1:224-1438(+)